MAFQTVPNPLPTKGQTTEELLSRILVVQFASLHVLTQILAAAQGRLAPSPDEEAAALVNTFWEHRS